MTLAFSLARPCGHSAQRTPGPDLPRLPDCYRIAVFSHHIPALDYDVQSEEPQPSSRVPMGAPQRRLAILPWQEVSLREQLVRLAIQTSPCPSTTHLPALDDPGHPRVPRLGTLPILPCTIPCVPTKSTGRGSRAICPGPRCSALEHADTIGALGYPRQRRVAGHVSMFHAHCQLCSCRLTNTRKLLLRPSAALTRAASIHQSMLWGSPGDLGGIQGHIHPTPPTRPAAAAEGFADVGD
ncbi:hypothetical protein BD309DRAFT_3228 [Dichomitus squalens]|nr:hypothetical protein BD309DRAFT_3228 [Dichomitus squalens]